MTILAAFIWFFKSFDALLLGPKFKDLLSPVNIIGEGLYE